MRTLMWTVIILAALVVLWVGAVAAAVAAALLAGWAIGYGWDAGRAAARRRRDGGDR
ncbi:hypothetical protein [Streptomyces bohaiensis]|uniref:hypothetical protein n=1 Tax=Streptomyces bohaiensis TaxID=1431344 RepID=UPI003B7E3AE8